MSCDSQPLPRRKWSEKENEVLNRFLDDGDLMTGHASLTSLLPAIMAQLQPVLESSLTSKQLATKIRTAQSRERRRPKLERRKAARHQRATLLRAHNKSINLRTGKSCITTNDYLSQKSNADVHSPLPQIANTETNSGDVDSDTKLKLPSSSERLNPTSTIHDCQHKRSESYENDDCIPLEEQLYLSWQRYVQHNRNDLLRSYETLDASRVEADVERLLTQVEEACRSLTKLLPHCHHLDVDELWNVLTGKSGQPAVDDFRALSFDHPPLSAIDRCRIFACAAIFKWVFRDAFVPKYIIDESNPLTSLMLGFIQEECHSIWEDFDEMNKQQWYSSMTPPLINDRAIKLTNRIYNLFESIHLAHSQSMDQHSTHDSESIDQNPVNASNLGKRTLYNTFLGNMIKAITAALNLQKDLARCSDLDYSFEFATIMQPFDGTQMQTRVHGDSQSQAATSIIACLFPSIWSSTKEGIENSRKILTKAIVIV